MHESLVKTISPTSAIPLAIWKLVSLTNPHISKYDFEGIARVFAMSSHTQVLFFILWRNVDTTKHINTNAVSIATTVTGRRKMTRDLGATL